MSRPLISLADYELAAGELMTPAAHSYAFGGAGDELTMRANPAAWQKHAIRPRVLIGVGERDPGVTLLGRPRPHPVIVAPMAFQRLFHPDGELATARAAAATGAIMCLATLATASPAALAQELPDAPRWFQVYVFRDRGFTREVIGRALDAGFEALVVTADVPVRGMRERELRNPIGPEVGLDPPAAAIAEIAGVTPSDFIAHVDPDLSWSDIERLAAEYPVPVLVKGILTGEDALLAREHGARGVVVSNHGGRQLDTVLTAADALAEVVDAVGDQLDVLVDGGVRRGTDVLRALALGARAVLVGRPLLWGLAVDGEQGARRVLEILLDELDTAMALAGAPVARDLDRSFLAGSDRIAERP